MCLWITCGWPSRTAGGRRRRLPFSRQRGKGLALRPDLRRNRAPMNTPSDRICTHIISRKPLYFNGLRAASDSFHKLPGTLTEMKNECTLFSSSQRTTAITPAARRFSMGFSTPFGSNLWTTSSSGFSPVLAPGTPRGRSLADGRSFQNRTAREAGLARPPIHLMKCNALPAAPFGIDVVSKG